MTEKQLAKIIEEEIISELEQQESEIILECNKQLKVVMQDIADMSNELWDSIIQQYYDSYAPNTYKRRNDNDLYKASEVYVNGIGITGTFGDASEIDDYPSILKDQSVDSQFVVDQLMEGNRGYKEGLEKILGVDRMRYSKYIREGAYKVKVKCKIGKSHSAMIEGSPGEVIDQFIIYAEKYIKRRRAEIWNSLLPKYPLVEAIDGRLKVR